MKWQQHKSCLAVGMCVLGMAGGVPAAELNVYANLTTDYVFRGVTYSDGDPAAQFGLEIGAGLGAYAGAWVSTIDINNGALRQRNVELSYYLGYAHELSSRWNLGASVVAVTYPEASGAVDYDYVEYSISANYDDRAWLEYSYSPDLHNSGKSTRNIEFYSEWLLSEDWSLGAGGGFYDTSALTGDEYAYWQLGFARQISRVVADLRYHDTNHWVPIISSSARTGPRIVLSVKFSF